MTMVIVIVIVMIIVMVIVMVMVDVIVMVVVCYGDVCFSCVIVRLQLCLQHLVMVLVYGYDLWRGV